MDKSFYRWKLISVIGLIVFAQLSFSVHITSARSLINEKKTVGRIEPGETPARLSADAWEQITQQMDVSYDQQAYLKAKNAEAKDYFGTLAIDGGTIVIGASEEDGDGSGPANNDATKAGAAYVFVRSGTTWVQQAYLKASNAEAYDHFGASVAIEGDTIVVGAPGENGDGTGEENNNEQSAGAAYVFVRSGDMWTQKAYLKASNAEAMDFFGRSVAIDGNTIVVGAHCEDSNGTGQANNDAEAAGAAYVFVHSAWGWTQQAYLKAFNAEAEDYFGFRVAIDGNTIVVGAHGEDSDGTDPADNNAIESGAAYVFARLYNWWIPTLPYLKASNIEVGDQFGYSVAIDGDTIVVGAIGEDSDGSGEENNDAINGGAAYVFMSIEGGRSQAYLKAANAEAWDQFGWSVAIDGNTIVVGAPYEDSNGTSQANNDAEAAGAAYVFVRSEDMWTQNAYLKASNAEAKDFFVYSAIDGNTIVVGAHFEDGDGTGQWNNDAEDAGAAYVFTKSININLKYYLPLIML